MGVCLSVCALRVRRHWLLSNTPAIRNVLLMSSLPSPTLQRQPSFSDMCKDAHVMESASTASITATSGRAGSGRAAGGAGGAGGAGSGGGLLSLTLSLAGGKGRVGSGAGAGARMIMKMESKPLYAHLVLPKPAVPALMFRIRVFLKR